MSKFSRFQDGGMLSNIKSKLGLADESPRNNDAYYDDYDEDRSEDAEESVYAGDYAYDNSPSVSTRPSRSGAYSRYDTTRPHLVSFDDVRASTQVPDRLTRDPLPPRRSASTQHSTSARPLNDYSAYAPTNPAPTSQAASRERSAGYESLFAPTTASSAAAPSYATPAPSASSAATTASFDPYQAYEGSGVPVYNPQRSMKVIKPASYDEVEDVAKTLKAGDVVVLQLRNTPSQLSKRILDFAFGVSSALDASVDCVADKVFVITRGKELAAEERTDLRNQGVF
ncbi:MAG: cell division protein SepF [Raoultibacter sp.]